MSAKLASAIMEATGADPVQLRAGVDGKALCLANGEPYSKKHYEFWNSFLRHDKARHQYYCQLVSWLRLLLKASGRAGHRKTNAVVNRLQSILVQMAVDFGLEANIRGILVEEGRVKIRTYYVSDLRRFPEYAKILGFEDRSSYQPEAKMRFEVPHGWIPGFAELDESPEFPPEVAKRFEHADYILDLNLPIPDEIAEAIADVTWRIKDFRPHFAR